MAKDPGKDAATRAFKRASDAGLGGGASRWTTGLAYFDKTSYLYVVYGVDGNWQATRADLLVTLSTAPNQTGTRPSTISALEALTYS